MAFNYPNFATNHPFLSAGQNMPPPPGVMQPLANSATAVTQPTAFNPSTGPAPTGQFPLNPAAGGDQTMQPPHVIAGQPPVTPGGLPQTPAGLPSFLQGLPPEVQTAIQNHFGQAGNFNWGSIFGNNGGNGFDRNGWLSALQTWRSQRPDMQGAGDPGALQAWRQTRPDRQSY